MPYLPRTQATLRLCAIVAAAGAALTSAPAFAQTVEEVTVVGRYGPDGEPRTLSRAVSFADLDITTQPGQEQLKQRISDTARELCTELGEPSAAGAGPVPSCRDQAVREASEQMRTAVAAARPRPADWTAPVPEMAAAPPPEPAPVAPSAETYSAPASATTQLITNGPVPDTPENRQRYGDPMSNAGKRTAPAGN